MRTDPCPTLKAMYYALSVGSPYRMQKGKKLSKATQGKLSSFPHLTTQFSTVDATDTQNSILYLPTVFEQVLIFVMYPTERKKQTLFGVPLPPE